MTAFVHFWAPRVNGWIVVMADHVLASVWARELSTLGRYVFSPIACVEPGSRVRLSGDGPSQWSVWLVVARPATRAFQHWGALPGAYVVPHTDKRVNRTNAGQAQPTVGGKPLWLMQALVRDYSRPGDLVCDPWRGRCDDAASGGDRGSARRRRRDGSGDVQEGVQAHRQRLHAEHVSHGGRWVARCAREAFQTMKTITELRSHGVSEAAIALRQWRLRFQVTQHALARSAGLPESSVSAYESGREPLTLRAAEKLRAGCRRVGPPNAELGAFDDMLARLRGPKVPPDGDDDDDRDDDEAAIVPQGESRP